METSGLFEKKFSILKEISDAMVITDNITVIANLMLDLAISYANAEKGSLMLTNESNELYILAARGFDANLFRTCRINMGEGIAGRVAKNRCAVLVGDIETDNRFKKKKRDHYKTRSFISCPVLTKNKLLGVLNISDRKDGAPFTKDEFALLQTIANQAAIVLENTFLMNQLRAKAAELEEINRKLVETDVVKTEFITRVSHDLRTPLNSIRGSIYFLQESEKQSKPVQKEFYEIISEETSTLVATVENLLDFLRSEDEIQFIKKSMINLIDVLKEAADQKFVKAALAKKNLQLELEVEECKCDVVGDRIRVIQLFIYLIEGLSHYLDKNDKIRITVKEGTTVKVNLALPGKLQEVMEPFLFSPGSFFFSEYSKEKLKLYLVRKIAEVLCWNITSENVDDALLITLSIPKGTLYNREAFVTATVEFFVDFISALMGLDTCSVMLRDELTGDLGITCSRGLSDEVIKMTRLRIGEGISGWVAREGKPLLVEDIENDPRFRRKNLPRYNTKSLLCLPLKVQDRIIGVLNLNNKENGEPFTGRDLFIASVVSERFLHLIERLFSSEYREDEYRLSMASFEGLLNAEKKYLKKDTLFPDLMIRVMDRLGRGEEEKRLAISASLLFDLGLVLISEVTLKKKRLLSSEVRTIKDHPMTGVSLLNHFEFSEEVKKAILHHHERYDGMGYPDGLKGDDIPFISRILSVVDSYCSLVRKSPYRRTFTKEEALEEVKKGAGPIYDPVIVAALEYVLLETV
jgi:GAF domain-containing protein